MKNSADGAVGVPSGDKHSLMLRRKMGTIESRSACAARIASIGRASGSVNPAKTRKASIVCSFNQGVSIFGAFNGAYKRAETVLHGSRLHSLSRHCPSARRFFLRRLNGQVPPMNHIAVSITYVFAALSCPARQY